MGMLIIILGFNGAFTGYYEIPDPFHGMSSGAYIGMWCGVQFAVLLIYWYFTLVLINYSRIPVKVRRRGRILKAQKY